MAEIDLCPRCQAPLKFLGATSCACGWKKRERKAEGPTQKERVFVDCAYECKNDATVRLMTKTGWANMCQRHHDMYHLAAAKAYTAELGLTTPAEMARWNKTHEFGKGRMHGEFLRRFEGNKPARLRIRERVPGEDDEQLEAVSA